MIEHVQGRSLMPAMAALRAIASLMIDAFTLPLTFLLASVQTGI